MAFMRNDARDDNERRRHYVEYTHQQNREAQARRAALGGSMGFMAKLKACFYGVRACSGESPSTSTKAPPPPAKPSHRTSK